MLILPLSLLFSQENDYIHTQLQYVPIIMLFLLTSTRPNHHSHPQWPTTNNGSSVPGPPGLGRPVLRTSLSVLLRTRAAQKRNATALLPSLAPFPSPPPMCAAGLHFGSDFARIPQWPIHALWGQKKHSRRGSNPQPLVSKTSALPLRHPSFFLRTRAFFCREYFLHKRTCFGLCKYLPSFRTEKPGLLNWLLQGSKQEKLLASEILRSDAIFVNFERKICESREKIGRLFYSPFRRKWPCPGP